MIEAQTQRRRLEPDQRREQILDCAVQLFGDRPYSAVSTTELAREAGVARGLLHHYFGSKRGLYLEVVRRMVLLPEVDAQVTAGGSIQVRVERSVDWFLDVVSEHGKTFVAVIGGEGVGDDPEIDQILSDADDLAAQTVLDTLGISSPSSAGNGRQRAVIRAYGGMVKAAIREWVRGGTLTRDQVRLLLIHALLAIVQDVLPDIAAGPAG
jgi:AcrR family transcriptional regulator